ncbi:MAG: pyruvate dehydrogenase [Deltaproteobacteria bacterium]|nr:MAG: pyruvate dehydrogenase [Deltaproteobacteria bacterium]
MATLRFSEAIDAAIGAAMLEDERIVVFGEDVPMLRSALAARFGADRVLGAPISEAGFVGAAVGAAMAGLRPVVELYMVDFAAVAMDALLNHMAKLEGLSGGRWRCPLVLRAPCGAGYGDGGQHGQALWGLLAAIPGLTVVVPSTPADAAGLMRSALEHDGPVIFMEHKLLSEAWLEFLGRQYRETVSFAPPAASEGEVPEGERVAIGEAVVRRPGSDVTLVSLAVGVHRALAAAEALAGDGVSCEVIDLRTVRPLDRAAVVASVAKTGRLVAVDEDYAQFGLSGELAALCLEAGLRFAYRRVAVEDTLPYARHLEDAALPNVERIVAAVREVLPA